MSGELHFDLLILGGGSGGYAAARTAASLGKKVAVVDGSETLGGLCILRGCMPSKTLLYAAEILHLAQKGGDFGLEIPSAAANAAAIQQRKRRIIEDFASYRQEQLQSGPFELFRAHGSFVDAHTLALSDGRKLKMEQCIIATGSVVQTPAIPGLRETPLWTSDDVLDLDFLPPSVIVLGGGVIACELAQYLHRIGSRVTLIQRSPLLLKETSPEAAEVIREAFTAEGMEVFTGTKLLEVRQGNGEVTVRFEHGEEVVERRAGHLFNALGRTPATEGLNLKAAGVETLKSGHIRTSPAQETTQPGIYAVGDCAGPHELVHLAIQQGEIAARHAAGETVTPVNENETLQVIFTDPQVAVLGPSLAALEDWPEPVISASYPFDDHGKSILMEAHRGYVKVFAEKTTGKVVRAECVGKDGGELIHALAVGLSLGATVEQLVKVPWYHPTLSEIWSYPLEDLADERAEPSATGTSSGES